MDLGVALRDAGLVAGLPIAISIRRNGQELFHAALPGASADNDGWLARKSAVVDRYGRSSLRVGEEFRVRGESFDEDSRLDVADFAAHGGAFPSSCAGPAASARSRSPGCPSWRTTGSSSRRLKPCWKASDRLESGVDAVDVAAEHDLRLRHQGFIA